MASGPTVLELTLQEELKKAGEGKRSDAVARTYRRAELAAFGELPPDQLPPDIGTLHVAFQACELHAYTLHVTESGAQQVVMADDEGFGRMVEYLCWCEAFFSHLAFVAPDLPPSSDKKLDVRQHAMACSTDLVALIAKLRDNGISDEDERAGEGDEEGIASALAISMDTFTALAKALLAIIFAWLSPEARRTFTDRFTDDLAELRGLRVLAEE